DVAEHLLQARSALCRHRPQMTGVKRAPRDGKIARSHLPFERGWQTQSGPPRECVGLIETHMTDRGGRIDRAKAAQAHLHEAAISLFPIKRRLPTLCLDAVPAIRQPQRWRGIAAIFDELDPLRIGDETVREFERTHQLLMKRALIVVGEAFASMADFKNAAGE